MMKSSNILGRDSLLAHHIDDFQYRAEQEKMAAFIEERLKNQDVGIVEAGTGTGKTFAYLVPILLSKLKAIISTGTKNLQDQLFLKDLPLICRALKSHHRIALLKGRANYLCLYRLKRNLEDGQFYSRQTIHEINLVKKWSTETQSGDISELATISEDAAVWPYVTSTADNCLGQDCPFYEKCYVTHARKEAQQADILVVNHHLFMADLALKGEGYGELLPNVSAVIFDEAHHLARVATQFFGQTLSSRQLFDLAKDIKQEYVLIAKDTPALKLESERIEKCVQDVRLAFGEKQGRGAWREIKFKDSIQNAIKALHEELDAATIMLENLATRSKSLEACARRCREIKDSLTSLTSEIEDEYIHWYETFSKNFTLNLTPINVAEPFMLAMQHYQCAWIFTSATIAIKNDFNYFARNLGLDKNHSLQLTSPFNFEEQAILYVPKNLPDPRSDHFTAKVIEASLPVLRASKGRAFLLFTSFRALYEAEQLLANRVDHPILVQGQMPKTQLLNYFREHGNAILLGTNSFWEGVDVRGEALSCVIIDKLPFASPGDPILKARIEKMRAQGQDPFNDYQLPQAVINLKQGVGRLIRHSNDRGVLMICDPRLVTSAYGHVFLESLPRMRYTQDITDIENFY